MANLRSIDNIETNDMNFKHLETTKDIVISPKNEYGDPQRPDATHTWSAKVSDGTNYVGDYAVKINGASLIVDSEDFTKLPVGKYTLEVWEQWTDPDGKSQLSIYPSPQQTIPFTIYANITDQAGKEIKEIGFQDVVDQAVMNVGMNYVFKANTIEPDQAATVVQSAADGKNYVTFNIPRGVKGDKGDTGTVDNAGLTTAPAFVSLQTQVNNSAVGTNLLLKTYDSFSVMGVNAPNQGTPMYSLSRRLEAGTTVTLSFDAVSTAPASFAIQNNGYDGGTWMNYIASTVDTTKKHYVATIKLDGFSQQGVYMHIDNIPSTTTITISNMKLELGSNATDWCPNPTEILTQSDYAKIQAAIVALGGSLK